MKISRANYEIWFTDSADNNLTREQVEELKVFLQLNPDLSIEYEVFMEAMNSDRHSCFRKKDRLKKSAAELPEDQFEMLSVAFHENDLTGIQKEELLEIVTADPEKARTFDVIGKIRLNPPEVKYGNKNALLKRSINIPVLMLTWVALGAAASIAAIMLVGSLFRTEEQRSGTDLADLSVAVVNNDSININKPEKLHAPIGNHQSSTLFSHKDIIAQVEKHETITDTASETGIPEKISIPARADIPVRISYNGTVLIAGIPEPGNYLASSSINYNPVVIDDGRSRISRFIARTFRDKILNEKVISDTPLKGYELAEAGIDGLNKLLGWEMAFTTNTDENGTINSVTFKSKIIKFSAPVKKNESAE
ncbi:MAG TPA: hypothetical protein VHO68_05750 [Bacteroidales bacterium]|nr:hypothetical protein [Bacteroidales bacterium]